ncbi:hypothetical protein QUB01_07725 [Microcoleus sp. CZ3-B4]
MVRARPLNSQQLTVNSQQSTVNSQQSLVISHWSSGRRLASASFGYTLPVVLRVKRDKKRNGRRKKQEGRKP